MKTNLFLFDSGLFVKRNGRCKETDLDTEIQIKGTKEMVKSLGANKENVVAVQRITGTKIVNKYYVMYDSFLSTGNRSHKSNINSIICDYYMFSKIEGG